MWHSERASKGMLPRLSLISSQCTYERGYKCITPLIVQRIRGPSGNQRAYLLSPLPPNCIRPSWIPHAVTVDRLVKIDRETELIVLTWHLNVLHTMKSMCVMVHLKGGLYFLIWPRFLSLSLRNAAAMTEAKGRWVNVSFSCVCSHVANVCTFTLTKQCTVTVSHPSR